MDAAILGRFCALLITAFGAVAPAMAWVVGPDGWTQLTASPDTRRVYVSSSQGSDANSGLDSAHPKQSIAAGISLLRDGYPDWLLLRAGDVWTAPVTDFQKGGRSADEPLVVTSYGGGPGLDRPHIVVPQGVDGFSAHHWGTTVSHLAVTDLWLTAEGPGAVGFSWLGAWNNVLFENCRSEGFTCNMLCQGAESVAQAAPSDPAEMTNITARRCTVADAHSVGSSHAQGMMWVGIVGGLLEECWFINNGWGSPEVEWFSVGLYGQGSNRNLTIAGCGFALSAAEGCMARSGGDIRGNLFADNAINLELGYPSVAGVTASGTVTGNVAIGGHDVGGQSRGGGFSVKDAANLSISGNLIAHQQSSASGGGSGNIVAVDIVADQPFTVTFTGNIVYDWKGPYYVTYTATPGVTESGNDLERPASAYPDPGRTMQGYAASAGYTLDGYYAAARAQSRDEWHAELRPGAAVDWLMAGFGRGAPACYADCNGDGILNGLDFTCFLDKYAIGDSWANCDQSTMVPVVNPADFTCFVQKFSAGCP